MNIASQMEIELWKVVAQTQTHLTLERLEARMFTENFSTNFLHTMFSGTGIKSIKLQSYIDGSCVCLGNWWRLSKAMTTAQPRGPSKSVKESLHFQKHSMLGQHLPKAIPPIAQQEKEKMGPSPTHKAEWSNIISTARWQMLPSIYSSERKKIYELQAVESY